MNLLKLIGIDDRFRSYIYSIIIAITIVLILNKYKIIIDPEDLKNLSNTIIGVSSIFASFLMAGLAIILQSPENENIKAMQKLGKFKLFIRYFKEAIFVCGITAIISVFLSLGGAINLISTFIFILGILLMIFLNYRVFHFLFKTLEDLK
ncbi:hypothetical protein GW846_03350 [Candidatus Gracilibacteria bacterium]|nr:hypothetical protein [Candidatus Gracilibacteria bacterium]